jgi:CRP-like cAMP-binding protein
LKFSVFFCSLVGEISALLNIQRMFTAVAGTDAELYVYAKEDFLNFIGLYPSMKVKLEKACLMHYKEALEASSKGGVGGGGGIMARNRLSRPDVLNHDLMDVNLQDARERLGIVVTPSESDLANLSTTNQSYDSRSYFVSADDPLRLPAPERLTKQLAGDDSRATVQSGSYKWIGNFRFVEKRKWRSRICAWFFTCGRVSRDEMGLIHVIQE